MATSSTAEARWGRGYGWGWGGAGFAAGAIIGGAIAARPYYPYGYYGYGGYPYYGPGCAWRTVWNGYAWVRACV